MVSRNVIELLRLERDRLSKCCMELDKKNQKISFQEAEIQAQKELYKKLADASTAEKKAMEQRCKDLDKDRSSLAKTNERLTNQLLKARKRIIMKKAKTGKVVQLNMQASEPTVWILRNCVIELARLLSNSDASVKSTMYLDSLLDLCTSNGRKQSGKYEFGTSGVAQDTFDKMSNSIVTDGSTKFTKKGFRSFFTNLVAENKGGSLTGQGTEVEIEVESGEGGPSTKFHGVDDQYHPDSDVDFDDFEDSDVKELNDIEIFLKTR